MCDLCDEYSPEIVKLAVTNKIIIKTIKVKV